MANPRYSLRIGHDPGSTVYFSILSEHTRSYTHLDIHVRLRTAACTGDRATDNRVYRGVNLQFRRSSMSSDLTSTTDGDGRRPQLLTVTRSSGHLQTSTDTNTQNRDEDEHADQRPSLAGPSRSRSQSQSHTASSGGKVRKKRALISCAGESPCRTCQVARDEYVGRRNTDV
jgi:hypothetical protein